MIKVLKWIAVVALAVWLGLTSCVVLEDDDTLIDIIIEHGDELAPIAKIIWEEDPIAIIDLRGGDITTESGREVRIEPESLISKISDEQIEALADAGVRLAHHDSFYGGVLFVTGEGGISISGAVTGLVWEGSEFNPELIVPNVEDAVEKEKAAPNTRKNYWFIRPVNDQWGIFYQVH